MKQQDDVILSQTNSNQLTHIQQKRYHKLTSMRTSQVFAQLELQSATQRKC